MSKPRSILLLLAAILLLSALPTFIYADAPAQGDTVDSQPLPADPAFRETDVPPIEDGAPYPYPVIPYEAPSSAAPASPDAPTIDVWYGTTQNFGQLGNPQEWINILGRVTGTTSLKYSLNGGADRNLTIGSTGERLYGAGDFNIELPYAQLNDGPNTVIIKASDGVTQITKTVTVNYDAGNTWPLPYTANWGALPGVQSGAQVVDGQWTLANGRLENVVPGYDRLVAIGDVSWTDYEVTVPVTVKSLNTAEWGPPSNGAGVGMIVHWLGHYDTGNGAQPNEGWRRFGALAWHRWAPNGTTAFEMRGNGGGASNIIASRTDRTIALNTPYIFKLSVQASGIAGSPSTYRFKFWPAGDSEPAEWYMTAAGNAGEPDRGSILLVAHQAMVSFGNVTVKPITTATYTINVQNPANGDIVVTPNKPNYAYGERVEIRAVGEGNNGLANWTGDFSGNQNPIVFDITQDVTVGAVFQPLAEDIKLNVAINGQGTVNVSPKKNKYTYGEVVTLTPVPNTGFIFGGWAGDLTGANNPAVIVMDRTKTITANFIAANAASPVSDDFNSCGLNPVWTFVNPVGDGSYSINGTQLLLNVPANVSHNIWLEGNRSVRVMQPTQNTDFEVVAKFESVVTQRYQMQGILVEQDSQNYLRFEVYHDGATTRLYAARFLNGDPKPMVPGIELTGGTPPFLRITRVGSSWSFSYSYNGTAWTSGGSFSHNLNVARSGVYGANHGTPPGRPAPAYTAIVDYFFNSASPINPEDGGTPGNFTVTVNKVGQGNVTLSPNKATYGCGEKVTLTAAPAAGWAFSGWSGDMTGSGLSQQLTVTRNQTVTATFVRGDYKLYLPVGMDQ